MIVPDNNYVKCEAKATTFGHRGECLGRFLVCSNVAIQHIASTAFAVSSTKTLDSIEICVLNCGDDGLNGVGVWQLGIGLTASGHSFSPSIKFLWKSWRHTGVILAKISSYVVHQDSEHQ